MSNCIFAFMYSFVYSFDVQTACQSFSRRLMLRGGVLMMPGNSRIMLRRAAAVVFKSFHARRERWQAVGIGSVLSATICLQAHRVHMIRRSKPF